MLLYGRSSLHTRPSTATKTAKTRAISITTSSFLHTLSAHSPTLFYKNLCVEPDDSLMAQNAPLLSSSEKPRARPFTPARAGIALLFTFIIALFILSPSSATHRRDLEGLMLRNPTGWHSRATPHPDGAGYEVKKENLVFGMTRNARVEQDGKCSCHQPFN